MNVRIDVGVIEDEDDSRQRRHIALIEIPAICGVSQSTWAEAKDMIDAKPDVILAVRRNRADDGEVDEELRTLKTLCHALPNTEVVVLSHASDDDAMRYLACGANGYLSEPLRPLALRQAIKDVLDAGCALSPLIARRLVNQLRQLALESDCSH